jgi:hypothetical protein
VSLIPGSDPGSKKVGIRKASSRWFISGSGLDPDSNGSVDPAPAWESGSGSRKAKMTRKERKLRNFMFEVLDVL